MAMERLMLPSLDELVMMQAAQAQPVAQPVTPPVARPQPQQQVPTSNVLQSFADALNVRGVQNAWDQASQNIRMNLAAGDVPRALGASVAGAVNTVRSAVPGVNLIPTSMETLQKLGSVGRGFVGGLAGEPPTLKMPAVDPTAMESFDRAKEMKAAPPRVAGAGAGAKVDPDMANFLGLLRMFQGMTVREANAVMQSLAPPQQQRPIAAKDVGGLRYLNSVEEEMNRIRNDPKATAKQKADASVAYRTALLKYIASGGLIPGLVADAANSQE